MPTVFVIGKDWRLRSLVRAELREHGVEALGMETLDDAGRAIASGTMPTVVVIDATSDAGLKPGATTDATSDAGLKPGATATKKAAEEEAALRMLAKRVPFVIVASHTEIAPELSGVADAAAVLYKPVSVGEVVARVEDLLKGLAA